MPLDNRTCFTVNLRDRLVCVVCGAVPVSRDTYHRGFEYHHIVPRSAGGADGVDNIGLLCHQCHLRQHREEPLVVAVRPVPESFSCKACTMLLDPQMVEMNCGWYRCHACHTQVHLFDHFAP